MICKTKKKSCEKNNIKCITQNIENKNGMVNMFSSEFSLECGRITQDNWLEHECPQLPGSISSKLNINDEKLVYFVIAGKWRMVGPGVFRK